MRIEYIWIDNYKDVLDNMNINFGGKKIYSYDKSNNKISFEKNELYIKDFFVDENNVDSSIEHINSVIGENGVGKTTILRLINELFSSYEFMSDYIIIYSYDKVCYGYYHLKEKLINEQGEITWIENKKNNLIQDSGHSVNIIYFSSVFDKSRELSHHNRLYDISTSHLVREFISSDNNYEGIDDFEAINEFRKKEIPQVLNLFKHTDQSEKDIKLLFGVPQKLYMEVNDTGRYYKEMLNASEFSSLQVYVPEEFIHITYYIRDILFERIKDKESEELKKIFVALGLVEILLGIFYGAIVKHSYYSVDEFHRLKDELKHYHDNIKDKSYFNSYDYVTELEKIIIAFVEVIHSNARLIINDKDKFIDDENISINNLLDDLDENYKELIASLEEEMLYSSVIDISEHLDEINEIVNIGKQIDSGMKNMRLTKWNQYNENLSKESIDLRSIYDSFQIQIQESNYNYETNKKYEHKEKYNHFKSLKTLEDIIEYAESYIFDVLEQLEEEITSAREDLINYNKFKNMYHEKWNQKIEEKVNRFRIYLEEYLELIKSFKNAVIYSEIDTTYYNQSNLRLTINLEESNFQKFIEQNIKLKFSIEQFLFDWDDLSSGQNSYLDMLSRLHDLTLEHKIDNSVKDIIILIDEGELYLHPNAQTNFLNNLISFFDKFFKGKRLHIILTSNSPFTVSDLPNRNIIYLSKIDKNTNTIKPNNGLTFGANIHLLLSDTFYMKDGLIGKFAQKKIAYIRDLLILENTDFKDQVESGKISLDFIRNVTNSIGEPIIRSKLLQLYEEKKKYIEKSLYSESVLILLEKFKELDIEYQRQFLMEIINGDEK